MSSNESSDNESRVNTPRTIQKRKHQNKGKIINLTEKGQLVEVIEVSSGEESSDDGDRFKKTPRITPASDDGEESEDEKGSEDSGDSTDTRDSDDSRDSRDSGDSDDSGNSGDPEDSSDSGDSDGPGGGGGGPGGPGGPAGDPAGPQGGPALRRNFNKDLRTLAYVYLCFWSVTETRWRDFTAFVLNRMPVKYKRLIRRHCNTTRKRKALFHKYFRTIRSGLLNDGYLEMRDLARKWLETPSGVLYQKAAALSPLKMPVLDPIRDARFIRKITTPRIGRGLFRRMLTRIDKDWVIANDGEWTEGWGKILQKRIKGWFLVEVHTQNAVGAKLRRADFTILEWRTKMRSGCYRDADVVHEIWDKVDEASQLAVIRLIRGRKIARGDYTVIKSKIRGHNSTAILPK